MKYLISWRQPFSSLNWMCDIRILAWAYVNCGSRYWKTFKILISNYIVKRLLGGGGGGALARLFRISCILPALPISLWWKHVCLSKKSHLVGNDCLSCRSSCIDAVCNTGMRRTTLFWRDSLTGTGVLSFMLYDKTSETFLPLCIKSSWNGYKLYLRLPVRDTWNDTVRTTNIAIM
jgi:hypothetical protein